MAPKKNYVINAQIGSIHKIALNDFFNRSQTYEIELTKINHANGDYEGTFKGKIKIMSYTKNFEDKVLDFMNKIDNKIDGIERRIGNIEKRLDKVEKRLDKVEKRLDNIEKRLDVLEKDVKEIKSLPTIQNELKNK